MLYLGTERQFGLAYVFVKYSSGFYIDLRYCCSYIRWNNTHIKGCILGYVLCNRCWKLVMFFVLKDMY